MRRSLVSRLQDTLPSLQRDLVFADIASELISKNVLAFCEYQAVLSDHTDSGRAKIMVDIIAGKEDATFYTFLDILRVHHSWLAEEIMSHSGLGDVTDSVPINLSRSNVSNTTNEFSESSNRTSRKRYCSPTNTNERRVNSAPCHSNGSTEDAVPVRPAEPSTSARDANETPSIKNDGENVNVPETDKNSNLRMNINAQGTERIQEDENANKNISQGVTEEIMSLLRKNHRASRDWTSIAHALGLSEFVNKIRMKVLLFGEDYGLCVFYLLQEWVGVQPKSATVSNLVRTLRSEGFNDAADEITAKFCS